MSSIFTETDNVREFILTQGPKSKYYIGCDSSVHRRHDNNQWIATYITVLVIHKNGNNGCKIFGKVDVEPIYNVKTQSMRLMTEVYKASEFYMELADILEDKYTEIHLDINDDPVYESHLILGQATGYVKGLCGITPKIKPEAFAASYAADRLIRVNDFARAA